MTVKTTISGEKDQKGEICLPKYVGRSTGRNEEGERNKPATELDSAPLESGREGQTEHHILYSAASYAEGSLRRPTFPAFYSPNLRPTPQAWFRHITLPTGKKAERGPISPGLILGSKPHATECSPAPRAAAPPSSGKPPRFVINKVSVEGHIYHFEYFLLEASR